MGEGAALFLVLWMNKAKSCLTAHGYRAEELGMELGRLRPAAQEFPSDSVPGDPLSSPHLPHCHNSRAQIVVGQWLPSLNLRFPTPPAA